MSPDANPKRFTVKPNPVGEGNSVTISGEPNDVVYVAANKSRQRIQLDSSGKAVVPEPVGAGKVFVISDFHPDDTHEIDVSVISLLK